MPIFWQPCLQLSFVIVSWVLLLLHMQHPHRWAPRHAMQCGNRNCVQSVYTSYHAPWFYILWSPAACEVQCCHPYDPPLCTYSLLARFSRLGTLLWQPNACCDLFQSPLHLRSHVGRCGRACLVDLQLTACLGSSLGSVSTSVLFFPSTGSLFRYLAEGVLSSCCAGCLVGRQAP